MKFASSAVGEETTERFMCSGYVIALDGKKNNIDLLSPQEILGLMSQTVLRVKDGAKEIWDH